MGLALLLFKVGDVIVCLWWERGSREEDSCVFGSSFWASVVLDYGKMFLGVGVTRTLHLQEW